MFYESAGFLDFLMIPIGCFIFFYSYEIIDVLLGFTSLSKEASDNAALFLKYLGLLLPFMVVNTLMARLFMASHKIKESFGYQVTFNIVLIIFLYVAVRTFGIIGYPIALVFTYFLNFGFCYVLEKKFFNFIDYLSVFREFWIIVVVNILTITLVVYCVKFAGMANSFLNIAVAGIFYFLLLLIVNRAFRLNGVVTLYFDSTLKKVFPRK